MWVDIFSEEDQEFLSHVENLITGGKIKLFNDNDSDNDNDGQSDSDNQVHTFGQRQSPKKGFGKVFQLYSTSF